MSVNNILLIVGAIVGAIFAFRGLARPFIGLAVLMTLHFIQPGELIPALAFLRIELVYGVLMLLIVLWTRSSVIKNLVKTDSIVRATIVLEAVVILTIPFAIWRGGAFEAAMDLLKMIILQLLMTVFIDSQDRLRSILWLLVGFMMWFAGSAFLAYSRGEFYVINGVQRAEGINSMVGGPNELAGLLLALLPFLVALLLCTKGAFKKLVLILCGGLGFFVLLLTGARISLMALLAMGIFAILRSKRKVISLTVAVVLALVVWFSLPAQYQKRYLTVKQYAEGGQLDDSNKFRLEIWSAGWKMILDHPILGVGAGQFPTAYGTIYAGRFHTAWMNPHNLFLQVTAELGIVGLIVFSYFLIQIWRANRWVLRETKSPALQVNHAFAAACYFMMVGIGVVSTVSHTLYRPYWYLLAGLVAANRAVTSKLLEEGVQGQGELGDEHPDSDNTLGGLEPQWHSPAYTKMQR